MRADRDVTVASRTVLSDSSGGFRSSGAVEVRNHDRSAFTHAGEGTFAADAAGGAGDQNYLIFE
jgi:hypothetical protein